MSVTAKQEMRRPRNIKLGTRFKINEPKCYGKQEIFTVTGLPKGCVDCTTTRFPGASHRFPNCALNFYRDRGQFEILVDESEARHAVSVAEKAVRSTPIGEHIRFEEIIEQGGIA